MNAAYISLGMVPLANEWDGPVFTDCHILRGPTLAVHLSHGSIESMGIDRLADREPLMFGNSHMNGCQNYGPLLGPIIIRHLIFRGPKRGP